VTSISLFSRDGLGSGVGGLLVGSKTPCSVLLVLSPRKACSYVSQKWAGRQDISELFVVEWMSECASNVVGLLPTSAAYANATAKPASYSNFKRTFQDMLSPLNVTRFYQSVPNTHARLTVELFTPVKGLKWLENRRQDPPTARPHKASHKRGKAKLEVGGAG
jgi:hypothetical protein